VDLQGQMDRVLVDAPCTGTGIWRRRPDAKWRISPEALAKRTAEQDAVLAEAATFVRPGGILTYATCSLLTEENGERIAAFRKTHPRFKPIPMREVWLSALPEVAPPVGTLSDTSILLTPLRSETDGFFVTCLRRDE
jgi:16S rRNA (cytosine967-C5)-methyltransferase